MMMEYKKYPHASFDLPAAKVWLCISLYLVANSRTPILQILICP